MSTTTAQAGENEVTILARILDTGNGQFPPDLARYFLDCQINERDRARMHDLAIRNQADGLTPDETAEMLAFGKAATLLSVLKSKARRTLGISLGTRTDS